MTDNELNRVLRQKAEEMGFCTLFHGLWKDKMSRVELIELYKAGIEYCIDNDFPSKDFILKNFDKHTLHAKGVFIDDNVSGRIIPSGVYVFNGKNEGIIQTSDFSVITMYARNDTSLTLQTGNYSKTFIHIYDNANVEVDKGLNSSVYIYRHHS